MRKWHRLFPTVIALGVIASVIAIFSRNDRADTTPAPQPAARTDFHPLALPPQLPIATGYTVVDAFPGTKGRDGVKGLTFNLPLCIAYPPGETDRLFVVSKNGTIEIVTDFDKKGVPQKKTLFMDLNPYLAKKNMRLGTDSEWGLLGLAFHPHFKDNGYFYITYNPLIKDGGREAAFDRISRFSVSKTDPNQADMTSELPLISQLDLAGNHNGGCIKFGQDGYLYTSIGDEGNANDSFNNASFIDKDFFAAIFRIDVDCLPKNLEPNPHVQKSAVIHSAVNIVNGHAAYKIPADNPLIGINSYFGKPVDPTKVRTEIYANGLRNAWRFSFDEPTGRLFVGDVGQDRWEEIDLIVKGGNYGWSYREGLHDGPRLKSKPPEAKLLDPIYEYGHNNVQHDEFTGNSVTGGIVYRGSNLTELTGAYIFGDYGARRIWALREKDGKWKPQLLATNVGAPVDFSADPKNGDILFTDIGNNNEVRRLVRTGVQGAAPPALLSQVGAFKNLQTLEPADGLVAYAPNVSFWSDYAIKQRWFMVPNAADKIGFNATGSWTFPAGMVWVKHFEMEMTRGDKTTRRRLETRFLVKTATGVYGITYKWRPDNSDADLVPEGGLDEELTINVGGVQKKQTWRYPSQSDCLSCHSKVAGEALGFNTWQLNGNGDGAENQIMKLAKAGYFSQETKIPDVKTLGAFAGADDESAKLDWRVRSYLAANCVQCHQPGGVVQGLWDARPGTAMLSAGLINGPLVSDRGDARAKVILPGDPLHSMLLERVEGNGVPRMPPLATSERDPAAEMLLKKWIESLK